MHIYIKKYSLFLTPHTLLFKKLFSLFSNSIFYQKKKLFKVNQTFCFKISIELLLSTKVI